jgi:hypothetical protein
MAEKKDDFKPNFNPSRRPDDFGSDRPEGLHLFVQRMPDGTSEIRVRLSDGIYKLTATKV